MTTLRIFLINIDFFYIEKIQSGGWCRSKTMKFLELKEFR